MEEKFLWKEKLKGNLKQKQDESLSFWKEHSKTMVLNEIQFLTKICSVLQGLLLCCVYQELCFISPERDVYFILCVVPLFASPPRLLRFKSAIVVLYLWSALKIWEALSLQEERKAFACDSDRSCLSPLADIPALWRPQILQITRCSSCSSVPLYRGQGTCRGKGLPVSWGCFQPAPQGQLRTRYD